MAEPYDHDPRAGSKLGLHTGPRQVREEQGAVERNPDHPVEYNPVRPLLEAVCNHHEEHDSRHEEHRIWELVAWGHSRVLECMDPHMIVHKRVLEHRFVQDKVDIRTHQDIHIVVRREVGGTNDTGRPSCLVVSPADDEGYLAYQAIGYHRPLDRKEKVVVFGQAHKNTASYIDSLYLDAQRRVSRG